jgi:hypothetical protein
MDASLEKIGVIGLRSVWLSHCLRSLYKHVTVRCCPGCGDSVKFSACHYLRKVSAPEAAHDQRPTFNMLERMISGLHDPLRRTRPQCKDTDKTITTSNPKHVDVSTILFLQARVQPLRIRRKVLRRVLDLATIRHTRNWAIVPIISNGGNEVTLIVQDWIFEEKGARRREIEPLLTGKSGD